MCLLLIYSICITTYMLLVSSKTKRCVTVCVNGTYITAFTRVKLSAECKLILCKYLALCETI